MTMNYKMLLGTSALIAVTLVGCGKKSSSKSQDDGGSGQTTSGSGSGGGSSLALEDLTLDSLPSADSLALSISEAGLNLDDTVTGTPPLFTAVGSDADSMAKNLAGDVAALIATIESDKAANNWSDMKDKFTTFFDAQDKCEAMELTSRFVQRLRQDTTPLCLLQASAKLGSAIMRVDSGEAIDDLTQVYAAGSTAKVLQMGKTDKGQPHYEIIEIAGTDTNPTSYHARYTTCLTSDKTAFRQNTLDIDAATGVFTFTSYKNGAKDDVKAGPDASFSLTGSILIGSDGLQPDTSKARSITFATSGMMGGKGTSVNQGKLSIEGGVLAAQLFATDSFEDANGNALSQAAKIALDVQYTGTGTADLSISQGAVHGIHAISGKSGDGSAISNTNDHSLGFAYDEKAAPTYKTVAESTYVTNVAAVDFASDSVLSQETPTAPDTAKLDSTPCGATPTTVIGFTSRPEDNAEFAAAEAACKTLPAEKMGSMCDPIRDVAHKINDAMHARKAAVGSATN